MGDELEGKYERKLKETMRTLNIVGFFNFVFSFLSCIIIALVIVSSKFVIEPEKRIWIYMFMPVTLISIVSVLTVARNNSNTLLIFNGMSLFINGLILGFFCELIKDVVE